jgi:hypothetical protein
VPISFPDHLGRKPRSSDSSSLNARKSAKIGELPKGKVGPLAQLVEQRTFNPWVDGSSPSGPTSHFWHLPLPLEQVRKLRILSGQLNNLGTIENMRAFRFIQDFTRQYILNRFLYLVDPNSTHETFLKLSILHLTEKADFDQKINLLEFGTGGKSSQIMTEFMDNDERIKLFSFENNLNWFNKHRKLYPSNERHDLIYVEKEDWVETALKVLKNIPKGQLIFTFIDSSPWSSRSSLVGLMRQRSDVFLIHDVDYFPHNKVFGAELNPIQFKKTGLVRYGKLDKALLGERNYDDLAKFWVEAFPDVPGYYTGPPTLIASDTLDVRSLAYPSNTIRFNSI